MNEEIRCLNWAKCKDYETDHCKTCRHNESRVKKSFYEPDTDEKIACWLYTNPFLQHLTILNDLGMKRATLIGGLNEVPEV